MDAITPRERKGTATVLADWISGLDYGDFPEDVVQQAKACCIDSIACAIGGIGLEPVRILLDVLSEEASAGTVPVPGTGRKLSLTAAAHFGSQAANALDFDDSIRAGVAGHPGATVVPPAFAVAAGRGASGRELLTAVVAGFEVSLRIGRAVQPSPSRRQEVMGFAPWQSFGALVGSAKLLKLTPDRIRTAFGLTGAQVPVPSVRKFVDGVRPYSWIKNSYGIGCEAAVLSALLAERGYHGNQEIFDGPNGFWIMCGSDQYRRELASEALGSLWLIREIGFKPYACCRWTHTMIDAIRSLKPKLDGRGVESIEVTGFRDLAYSLAGDIPQTIVDAQFNARYVAALELSGHSPEQGLHEAQLADPRVLRLARVVKLNHDPDFDKPFHEKGTLPVRVDIQTTDGETLTARVDHPRGSAARGGFSDAEMDQKFLQLVSPVLGESQTRRALNLLRTMEQHSAQELSAALVP